MSIIGKIAQLTKQLYPTGRAFKMPIGSFFEKYHTALNLSEDRAYRDALSILDSALPDNDNFTAEDATDWERRLGLISNELVSLADRKLAIKRKMNHPGDIAARQHYLYLEGQLQAAGFDVYVYENRFDDGFGGYITMNPSDVGLSGDPVQLADGQLGDFQLGGAEFQIVANSIFQSIDASFDVGTNLRSTFFIGGTPIGTSADVDQERELEFRQLILKIKPAQTVAYLFVNYI